MSAELKAVRRKIAGFIWATGEFPPWPGKSQVQLWQLLFRKELLVRKDAASRSGGENPV